MDECREDSKIALQGVKMPSAANVKIDKQISSAENALADTGNTVITPLRQAITIIEHKIRNLEKRKVSHKPIVIAIYLAIPKISPQFFLSIPMHLSTQKEYLYLYYFKYYLLLFLHFSF